MTCQWRPAFDEFHEKELSPGPGVQTDREILDRVASDTDTALHSGRPVASLHPLPRRGSDPATLLEHWRHLPHLDPTALRQDIDHTIDPSL